MMEKVSLIISIITIFSLCKYDYTFFWRFSKPCFHIEAKIDETFRCCLEIEVWENSCASTCIEKLYLHHNYFFHIFSKCFNRVQGFVFSSMYVCTYVCFGPKSTFVHIQITLDCTTFSNNLQKGHFFRVSFKV